MGFEQFFSSFGGGGGFMGGSPGGGSTGSGGERGGDSTTSGSGFVSVAGKHDLSSRAESAAYQDVLFNNDFIFGGGSSNAAEGAVAAITPILIVGLVAWTAVSLLRK